MDRKENYSKPNIKWYSKTLNQTMVYKISPEIRAYVIKSLLIFNYKISHRIGCDYYLTQITRGE